MPSTESFRIVRPATRLGAICWGIAYIITLGCVGFLGFAIGIFIFGPLLVRVPWIGSEYLRSVDIILSICVLGVPFTAVFYLLLKRDAVTMTSMRRVKVKLGAES